jgi:PAS domain-containing protein
VKAAASALHSMDLEAVLEHINVPSYLIDAQGIIRWVNPAARRIVGDVTGVSSRPSWRPRIRAARVSCSRGRS